MTRIAIVAIGSRGDVAPLTGIGERLQDAGYEVAVVGLADFAPLVSAAGLEFRGVDLDLGVEADLADANPLRLLAALYAPKGMRTMGESIIAALEAENPDILLLSPIAEIAGHPFAESRGIPSMGLRLQPLTPTRAYSPTVLGIGSMGPVLNLGVGRLATGAVDMLYGGAARRFRRDLGLPARSARLLRRGRDLARWPILYGYSDAVASRPDDWRPGVDVVGYWWSAAPAGWSPPQELADFLEAGPPPVYIGFGSMVNSADAAQRLSRLVASALQRAGTRGIVQAGWAGLDVDADHVLTISDTPHDWLFERVSVVAHACGAGTVGTGLRAGRPAIGLPFGVGDQRFWAGRLRQLGVSPATILQHKLTEERLADAIGVALNDERYRENAESVAERIRSEDGAGRVLETVGGVLAP